MRQKSKRVNSCWRDGYKHIIVYGIPLLNNLTLCHKHTAYKESRLRGNFTVRSAVDDISDPALKCIDTPIGKRFFLNVDVFTAKGDVSEMRLGGCTQAKVPAR